MTEKLNARQQKALASLLAGSTMIQAADQAGCSVRQVFRWLDQNAFRQALKDAQQIRLERIGVRLLVLADQAEDTLEDVLSDPGRPGQAVASVTADRVLSHALKWRDLVTLEERLAVLEQKVGLK